METLKYYLKYIKTHLYFLFSKRNLIVISSFNLILLVYTLYVSGLFKGLKSAEANRMSYISSFNNDFFFLLKIIYISFILFLNISYFGREYKEYSQYFIRNRRTKIDFYITKYLSFILFDLSEIAICFLDYIIIYSIMPYGRIDVVYFSAFINIFFLGIFYSLLSTLLILIFKTYLSSVFALLFFWISYIYSEYGEEVSAFKKYLLFIFPFPAGTYSVYEYGTLHILLYIILLCIFNVFVLLKKDDL